MAKGKKGKDKLSYRSAAGYSSSNRGGTSQDLMNSDTASNFSSFLGSYSAQRRKDSDDDRTATEQDAGDDSTRDAKKARRKQRRG